MVLLLRTGGERSSREGEASDVAFLKLCRVVRSQVLALFEQMYSVEGGVPNLGNVPEGDDGDARGPAQGVPKPALLFMKLKARLARLIRQ